MTLRVAAGPWFERDLEALSPVTRTELWRLISKLRIRPFASGLGYSVNPLRRAGRPGIRVAHFQRDQFRLLFEVDGDLLILVGVGTRPGFYRRLDRRRSRSE